MNKIVFILLFSLFVFSCSKNKLPPIDNKVDLDGPNISDSSLITPAAFLLSSAIPNPTAADLQKHVIITAHGYSASNFEWLEFSSWAKTKTDLLVSRVLLGGHGRDYSDFQKAKWTDWQKPIIEEYDRLVSMGYKNISLAGSSTGCPLILDMISAKKISTDVLKHIFLIDPIVIPSNKILPLAPAIGGWAINYTTTQLDPGENGYWYKYRPHQSLTQLDKITRHVRKELEKGIDLPQGITLTVYKAEHDGAADPASAVLIQKGVKGSIVKMIDTDLHVFTRLLGRALITTENKTMQLATFEEIYQAL